MRLLANFIVARSHACVRVYVRVCVCACVRACVCMCACVYVCSLVSFITVCSDISFINSLFHEVNVDSTIFQPTVPAGISEIGNGIHYYIISYSWCLIKKINFLRKNNSAMITF